MNNFKHEFNFSANETAIMHFFATHNSSRGQDHHGYIAIIRTSDNFVEITIKFTDGQMTLELNKTTNVVKGTVEGKSSACSNLMGMLIHSLNWENGNEPGAIDDLSIFLPEVAKRLSDKVFDLNSGAVVVNSYQEACVYLLLLGRSEDIPQLENKTYPMFLYPDQEEHGYGYGFGDLRGIAQSILKLEKQIEDLRKIEAYFHHKPSSDEVSQALDDAEQMSYNMLKFGTIDAPKE